MNARTVGVDPFGDTIPIDDKFIDELCQRQNTCTLAFLDCCRSIKFDKGDIGEQSPADHEAILEVYYVARVGSKA